MISPLEPFLPRQATNPSAFGRMTAHRHPHNNQGPFYTGIGLLVRWPEALFWVGIPRRA